MRKVVLCILTTVLLFTGCDQESISLRSSRENFDALWKLLDENYCFFEYKQVDWNDIYDKYSPQISDTLNQYQLFDILAEMMAELKDGHTNLVSSFDVARYWAWYEDYPTNFYTSIQENYLGKSTDYKQAGGVKYRTIADDKIGYIYYPSFSNGVGESNLDHIFYYFKDCIGLIIDIRDNGGGSLTYSDLIASRFLEQKILSGYIQHKTGKGHNDFSDPYPVYLEPSERSIWLRPVVVLTNRHCYSAANDFVQKMKLLPQVVVIGDHTGGGSGFPFSSELPIGWSVRFSSSPMLDVNKEHTEFGIPPDIHVDMTVEDIKKGLDTIIEAAIANIQERGEKKEEENNTITDNNIQ